MGQCCGVPEHVRVDGGVGHGLVLGRHSGDLAHMVVA